MLVNSLWANPGLKISPKEKLCLLWIQPYQSIECRFQKDKNLVVLNMQISQTTTRTLKVTRSQIYSHGATLTILTSQGLSLLKTRTIAINTLNLSSSYHPSCLNVTRTGACWTIAHSSSGFQNRILNQPRSSNSRGSSGTLTSACQSPKRSTTQFRIRR